MNLRNIYDSRRIWKVALIVVLLVLMVVFIVISNNLVKDLSKQERDRMEIWANATKELASMGSESQLDSLGNPLPMVTTNVDFLLSIIEDNHNIPVLLVDDHDNILLNRNFKLPEPVDSLDPTKISDKNRAFLERKLDKLKRSANNKIEIDIDSHTTQYLYFEESTVLRRLTYFPYVELAVIFVFLAIAYFALVSIKKAEQNKVWVGLSKETAHQLGTPISSLMAWTQMLDSMGVDHDIVADMDKDVHRLSVIADRFSKIGSMPEKELTFINEAVEKALEYMSNRIPKRVRLTIHTDDARNCGVMLCQSLFEWVMENLTKNAVDAMSGEGSIDITVTADGPDSAVILVKDTGKGIPRKNWKDVFTPGFTTKKRGWGLGLTLVKRIIEEYHNGKIYIKESEIGHGTTFCIELPKVKS